MGYLIEFEYKGFPCFIKELDCSYSRHLCGYVAVPNGTMVNRGEYDVHGGVTFFEFTDEFTKGEARLVIGFDCAHSCDYPGTYIPGAKRISDKDQTFVRAELHKLVDQIILGNKEDA